jgi:hypothetical protein
VKRALFLAAVAAASVLAGAAGITATWHLPFGHAAYCSLATAATVGCDVTPSSGPGQAVAVAVMLTALPLLAAAFGQLHLDRVRAHIDVRHEELKRHLRSDTGGSSEPQG